MLTKEGNMKEIIANEGGKHERNNKKKRNFKGRRCIVNE